MQLHWYAFAYSLFHIIIHTFTYRIHNSIVFNISNPLRQETHQRAWKGLIMSSAAIQIKMDYIISIKAEENKYQGHRRGAFYNENWRSGSQSQSQSGKTEALSVTQARHNQNGANVVGGRTYDHGQVSKKFHKEATCWWTSEIYMSVYNELTHKWLQNVPSVLQE